MKVLPMFGSYPRSIARTTPAVGARCDGRGQPRKGVNLSAQGSMEAVRPSRRTLRVLLRMTFVLNAIINLRHPEERRGTPGTRLEGRWLWMRPSFEPEKAHGRRH